MPAGELFDINDLYPASGAIQYLLTRSGFFSEFNILCYAYAYAISTGQHLYVSDQKFQFGWGEVFDIAVRTSRDLDPAAYGQVLAIGRKVNREAWDAMRRSVREACDRQEPVAAPALGVDGTFTDLVFAIAGRLFRPSASIRALAASAAGRFGLESAPFVAIQVRRGDKVHGYQKKSGGVNVEGDNVPLAAYRARIDALAPELKDVFVLTDDYGEFEALAEQNPDLRFHTLCLPQERGYVHADYLAQDARKRFAATERLLASALIAARSSAFVGVYKSNLSGFIHMVHPDRTRCASVDSQRTWQAL